MSIKNVTGLITNINRLRIDTDGPGVTTLVGMYGCPLKCKYCINANNTRKHNYTVEELYNAVKIDRIYFDHTGGGICFGGHEPLLQQEFIIEFIKYIRGKGHTWKIGIETSLNVDKYPKELISLLDFIICDIKDTNNEIYREYTGQDNYNVMVNLKRLLNVTDFSSRALDNEFSIKLRLPLIHGYNTYKDIEKSEKLLEDTYLFAKYELDKFEYRFGGRES